MEWCQKRVAEAGIISDFHDSQRWEEEKADPVMNQDGDVQAWLCEGGDGAEPRAGKHGGLYSCFFSAKR